MEGVVGPSTSKVHEEVMDNYIEGTRNNIGSSNCEYHIIVSLLASLHGGEMTENQRQDLDGFVDYEQEHNDDDMIENQRKYFVYCGKHPSDDDISSCVEIHLIGFHI